MRIVGPLNQLVALKAQTIQKKEPAEMAEPASDPGDTSAQVVVDPEEKQEAWIKRKHRGVPNWGWLLVGVAGLVIIVVVVVVVAVKEKNHDAPKFKEWGDPSGQWCATTSYRVRVIDKWSGWSAEVPQGQNGRNPHMEAPTVKPTTPTSQISWERKLNNGQAQAITMQRAGTTNVFEDATNSCPPTLIFDSWGVGEGWTCSVLYRVGYGSNGPWSNPLELFAEQVTEGNPRMTVSAWDLEHPLYWQQAIGGGAWSALTTMDRIGTTSTFQDNGEAPCAQANQPTLEVKAGANKFYLTRQPDVYWEVEIPPDTYTIGALMAAVMTGLASSAKVTPATASPPTVANFRLSWSGAQKRVSAMIAAPSNFDNAPLGDNNTLLMRVMPWQHEDMPVQTPPNLSTLASVNTLLGFTTSTSNFPPLQRAAVAQVALSEPQFLTV